VDSFKDFFKLGTNKRHRNPLGTTDTDRHYRRKKLNLVPAMYKTKANSNHKIETLKKHSGRFICEPQDVAFIVHTYLKGVKPSPGEMKMLGGKMGIKFYHDSKINKWVIEK